MLNSVTKKKNAMNFFTDIFRNCGKYARRKKRSKMSVKMIYLPFCS